MSWRKGFLLPEDVAPLVEDACAFYDRLVSHAPRESAAAVILVGPSRRFLGKQTRLHNVRNSEGHATSKLRTPCLSCSGKKKARILDC